MCLYIVAAAKRAGTKDHCTSRLGRRQGAGCTAWSFYGYAQLKQRQLEGLRQRQIQTKGNTQVFGIYYRSVSKIAKVECDSPTTSP
jgi:hypothetical protein